MPCVKKSLSFAIIVEESLLDLRYPFWHDTLLSINGCKLTEKCRAALWYSQKITMIDTIAEGVKVFRECNDIKISNTKITSPEPFWFCRNVNIKDSYVEGEYAFLSNFYESPIVEDGITYPTNEHYFQAMKTKNLAERKKIADANGASAAKYLGRRVKLREDWEEIKEILHCKIEEKGKNNERKSKRYGGII